MNSQERVRTRFAPSPTGVMHLGNVRAALMSFVLAKKLSGSFVLRIEDTDEKRSTKESEKLILESLNWLGIYFDEGPEKFGNFGPYRQSERKEVYKKYLSFLESEGKIYRCFCSKERLDEVKKNQIKEKKPPRYDRKCVGMSLERTENKLKAKLPFIWRFLINQDQKIIINDLAKGKVSFDLKNFSDFSITRPDGTFTFIFTNFVDDAEMKISHVVRGEDHLSNSPLQAALYHSFSIKAPVFWHLPIICDQSGKKLSKRFDHFNLKNLKDQGFLSEAIINYLSIISQSLENEFLEIKQIIKSLDLKKINPQSTVKYDPLKLSWLNKAWLEKISEEEVLKRLKKDLSKKFSDSEEKKLKKAFKVLKKEASTLLELFEISRFSIKRPEIKNLHPELEKIENLKELLSQISQEIKNAKGSEEAFQAIKNFVKEKGLKIKEVFSLIRFLCTEKLTGISIKELFEILEIEEIILRLNF